MKRLFLLLILLIAGAAVYLALVTSGPRKEVFVDIAPGTGSAGIGSQLEHAGVIRNRYAFMALRLLKRGSLKAGEYRFAEPESMSEVYDRLRRGDVYFRAVTIPEGYNIFDVASAVEASGIDTKETFLQQPGVTQSW